MATQRSAECDQSPFMQKLHPVQKASFSTLENLLTHPGRNMTPKYLGHVRVKTFRVKTSIEVLIAFIVFVQSSYCRSGKSLCYSHCSFFFDCTLCLYEKAYRRFWRGAVRKMFFPLYPPPPPTRDKWPRACGLLLWTRTDGLPRLGHILSVCKCQSLPPREMTVTWNQKGRIRKKQIRSGARKESGRG